MYLLKVSIGLAVLYLFYWFILRKTTFFGLNRFYLIGSLIIVWLLPFLSLDLFPENITSSVLATNLDGVFMEWSSGTNDHINIIQQSHPIHWTDWLLFAYLAGSILMSFKFCLAVASLVKIKKKAFQGEINGQKVLITPGFQPFTFLQHIFIPNIHIDQHILAHEQAHVRQLHFIDLLLIRICYAILWFNPFVYLLGRSVRHNHEFLADQAANNNIKNTEDYLWSLYQHASTTSLKGPVFNFNSKPIIKRIIMLTKTQTSKWYYLAYLSILPVLFLLISGFSPQPVSPIHAEVHLSVIENPITTDQGDPIPSIWPVNKHDIASGYGMRRHPITKERKLHNGIDLKSKSGEPVYATADGQVVTSELREKRGHYIIIKHNNTYSTGFAHLESRSVAVGDKVVKGQVIGKVGSSGVSTAPHLHYEVMKNEKFVDPSPYMK